MLCEGVSGRGLDLTRTAGTQVVRKSVIQAGFKHLLDLESQRLALRAGTASRA